MAFFTDVTCTVCGCVCDDLRVDVAEDGHVSPISGACWLAKPWFEALNTGRDPIATIADSPVSLEAALDHAAAILGQSKSPLIYGLSRSTTEGQRAATALAERLGAGIDTTASTGHAASILAMQRVGESTCTLGEVKQRADLVIFWGSDPVSTHPRHIERYCPPRPGRTIVVVDGAMTETARRADRFIPIEPERDWEALWHLRLGLKDSTAEGGPAGELRPLLTSCRFGIVFFGSRLARGPLAHRTIEALLQLVTDLNSKSRFYARRMRRFGDVAGADAVLAWQTGYPFGVDFALGFPRYNPGEFTGPDRLARREVDACVLVGSDTAVDLPDDAKAHLRTIPIIRLDSPGVRSEFAAEVAFTTAACGVHRPGTAYRLDDIPIPLRQLHEVDWPSDADVLNGILRRIQAAGNASEVAKDHGGTHNAEHPQRATA